MVQVIDFTRAAEHVLGAAACAVHPGNGNVYGVICIKQHGINQDLAVIRRRPPYNMSQPPEIVKVYDGAGADSDGHITMGGCAILPNGALYVMFSAVPKGFQPTPPDTGFTAMEDLIPNVDQVYPLLHNQQQQIGLLERQKQIIADQVTAMQQQLDALQSGAGDGLSDAARRAINWLVRARALPEV